MEHSSGRVKLHEIPTLCVVLISLTGAVAVSAPLQLHPLTPGLPKEGAGQAHLG